MKSYLFSIVVSVLLLLTGAGCTAQPFVNEINAFKKQDSIALPPAGSILFVGSSSFRMWKDVSDYFPDRSIVNRGFGGSALPDVITYAKDIILPYNPGQIVIYCGENDIAASENVSATMVAERFTTLFNMIRKKFKKVPILFVSIKPSPSRWSMRTRVIEANKLIREFLAKKKNTAYADVYTPMLNEQGEPRSDIFLGDRLHMNAKGYAIWKDVLDPYLIKTK